MQLKSIGSTELLLILLAVVGIVIALVRRGRRRKANTNRQLNAYAPAAVTNQPRKTAATYAKRCPTCSSIFTDETLAFCLSDGSTLERVANPSGASDTNATYVYPPADRSGVAPTIRYQPNRQDDGRG